MCSALRYQRYSSSTGDAHPLPLAEQKSLIVRSDLKLAHLPIHRSHGIEETSVHQDRPIKVAFPNVGEIVDLRTFS
jgi:hypothetical protein